MAAMAATMETRRRSQKEKSEQNKEEERAWPQKKIAPRKYIEAFVPSLHSLVSPPIMLFTVVMS